MPDVFLMVDQYRKSGDPELLGDILETIAKDITLYVAGRIPRDDIPDVRQNVLLEIAKGLSRFRGKTREQFFSWCYVISRAAVANHHRKRNRQPQTHPDLETLLDMVDQSAARSRSSEEDIRDAREAIELLRSLDPECAELLFKYYVLELGLDEIGEQHGISANAARMRINRCEGKLDDGG